MDKAELIRHEIEKRRDHNLAIGNPLFAAMAEEDIELLFFIDSLQEEPVSDDLEEAANAYISNENNYTHSRTDTFKAGAKWQEQQFEKNRLAACDRQTEKEADIERDFVMSIIDNEHRQPTFDDAIKYGMRLRDEQMMKDAIKRTVKVDAGGFPYIDATELYDYIEDKPLAKDGEKVKLIIVKED